MRTKKLKSNKKYKNKKRLILTITIMFLIFGTFVLGTAKGDESHNYIEVYVEPGDTLWQIATTYYPDDRNIRKTIYQIKKNNNISGYIYPGQILILDISKY